MDSPVPTTRARGCSTSDREERDRLRKFFELHGDAIWCFELEPPVSTALGREKAIRLWLERGRLIQCNDALARMYGYGHAHELIGTPLRVFLDLENPSSLDYLRRFWDAGLRLDAGESWETDRRGRELVLRNAMIGVTAGDSLVRIWGTQHDVTYERTRGSCRQRALRLRAVEELADGMAHHFNNMLTIISGNLNLVLDAATLPADQLEVLRRARDVAEHAAGVTRQLFTLGHDTHLEQMDLQAAVITACRALDSTLDEHARARPAIGPPVRRPLALVVGASEDALRGIRRLLLESGYRVLIARSAADGLSVVREHTGRIDLALSTVSMPDKADVELARELRAQEPRIPLLLMSQRGLPDGADPQQADGIETIQAPFSREKLDRHLRGLLSSRV